MAKAQTFRVTHLDGSVSTRTSQTRTYTHAVVVLDGAGYRVVRWSMSQAGAEKYARRAASTSPRGSSARVVEVDA